MTLPNRSCPPVEQLGEKRLVVAVGSVVQAQAARGERRDSGAGLRNQRSCFFFQDKDLEFFTDQRFRAAPCLSTEFLKSWFCNDLRFCALHRKARKILRDPERERAPGLREILKTNVKICARTINTHTRTHTHARAALPSLQTNSAPGDGVETAARAVQYGGERRGGALLKAPVSYPPFALTCLRAGPKMAGQVPLPASRTVRRSIVSVE